MDSADFYKPVLSELCQGDVFECLPLVFLKDKVLPARLKSENLSGARAGFGIEQFDPKMAAQPQPFKVAADCIYASAILLTYDCEIDKPNAKELNVALVRSLGPLPDETKETIRANKSFGRFYLPKTNDLPERFVDFGKAATISVDLVRQAKRQSSLSTDAWKAFVFQFVRYVTRYDLDLAMLKRP